MRCFWTISSARIGAQTRDVVRTLSPPTVGMYISVASPTARWEVLPIQMFLGRSQSATAYAGGGGQSRATPGCRCLCLCHFSRDWGRNSVTSPGVIPIAPGSSGRYAVMRMMIHTSDGRRNVRTPCSGWRGSLRLTTSNHCGWSVRAYASQVQTSCQTNTKSHRAEHACTDTLARFDAPPTPSLASMLAEGNSEKYILCAISPPHTQQTRFTLSWMSEATATANPG